MGDQPPVPPYAAPPAASPYAAPPATPPYPATPYPGTPLIGHDRPEQVGPWGGPLSPVVLLDRAAITSTSRLSVLFRVILAIPHFVVFVVLGIAQAFVVFVAWFAALFTGEVPEGMYRFIAWVHGYGARVNGYLFLLTDKWPTIDAEKHYPIATRFPGPTRLNRAAVFFRYFISIPALLLAAIITYGLEVLSFPIWLIVLIRGRVPESIFDSLARVLRYQVRTQAYYAMLTSAYPSGLYGVDPPVAELPPPADYTLEPIRYAKGTRNLITTYIVLGPMVFIGAIVAAATLGSSEINANNKMIDAANSMERVIGTSPNCPSGPTQLQCAQNYGLENTQAVHDFITTFDGLKFPSKYSSEVATVKTDAQTLLTINQQLGAATSLQQYEQVAQSAGPANSALVNAINALHLELRDDID